MINQIEGRDIQETGINDSEPDDSEAYLLIEDGVERVIRKNDPKMHYLQAYSFIYHQAFTLYVDRMINIELEKMAEQSIPVRKVAEFVPQIDPFLRHKGQPGYDLSRVCVIERQNKVLDSMKAISKIEHPDDIYTPTTPRILDDEGKFIKLSSFVATEVLDSSSKILARQKKMVQDQ